MPDNRPNILIFMTDQEQADVVRPEHPCITPNATRLAEQGLLFTRSYCPTAHCCPSRATFMTGLYPSRHGVYNNVSTPTAIHHAIYPGIRMFSEDLRDSGYHLTYAGKWHATDAENPADRGWEELLVTGGKGSYMHTNFERWQKIGQEMAAAPDQPRARGQVLRPGWGHYQLYKALPATTPKGYETHHDYKVARAGIEALPRLAASGKPWTLFLGPHGPHDPFHVSKKFVDMYDPKKIELPASFADTLEDKPRIYQRMRQQYWGQLTEDEVRESIAHYWAYCTMEDAILGEVLAALDATGQADNTLVLLMSDHGDYCGAHGLYCKGVPSFREAVNIPTIARWPAGIKNPGRIVDEFITMADFAPTFLELAGCKVPGGLTGRSMVGFLNDAAPSDWPDAYYGQMNGVELYYTQRVVQTKEHKYVYNGFDFDEMYDLKQDPYETVNLASPARAPQVPLHAEFARTTRGHEPWPRLSRELEQVRRELLRKMWRFARRENDYIFNGYATVAMAPHGPADALADD